MAIEALKAIMDGPRHWDTPQQFAVLAYLAWKQRDDDFGGFADPELEAIADRFGCSRGRVQQIVDEIKELPFPICYFAGQRSRQAPPRYVITPTGKLSREVQLHLFDDDHGTQQAGLFDHDRGPGARRTNREAKLPGSSPLDPGAVEFTVLGSSPLDPAGSSPLDPGQDLTSVLDKDLFIKATPSAARPSPAAARLPAPLPVAPVPEEVRAKARRRQARLRPQRYRKVAFLARKLLRDAAFARQWNGGAPIVASDPAAFQQLLDALKDVCGHSGFTHGYPHISAAVTSELYKARARDPKTGEIVRARDRARRRGGTP